MAKNKNDYFRLTEEQASCCVEASELLTEILCDFAAEQIPQQKRKMHAIENRADELQHKIVTGLAKEFITPIDQEDILLLVQIIDDVTDALDEVVLELYMFHIKQIPKEAPAFSRIVNRCVKTLSAAIGELKNFKKPDELRRLLVEVNDVEAEADTVYIEAIHRLFAEETRSCILLGHKAIYESLENCCDLCEHAADMIEQIIIKNT